MTFIELPLKLYVIKDACMHAGQVAGWAMEVCVCVCVCVCSVDCREYISH